SCTMRLRCVKTRAAPASRLVRDTPDNAAADCGRRSVRAGYSWMARPDPPAGSAADSGSWLQTAPTPLALRASASVPPDRQRQPRSGRVRRQFHVLIGKLSPWGDHSRFRKVVAAGLEKAPCVSFGLEADAVSMKHP